MKRIRALPLTITLGSILVVLALTMTTLWNIVMVYNTLRLKQTIGVDVLGQWVILGIGSFLFVVIITGITLFIIFMSRQIIVNQMQKNFIDSMTHELRTPITSLRLYVETLQRHQLEGAKREQFLHHMLQDVEYLDSLVSHVLEGAKVEYRKELSRQPVDVDALVCECLDTLRRRYQFPAEGIHYQPQGIVYPTDPHALRLILLNLLDNALKYSPEPPEITLCITASASDFQIQVSDKGRGLLPGDLKRIFRRFYRGSSAGQAKGSGLGLYIVNETVRQLRGQINVDSPGKDLGTTFTITLPA